jgi:N utilization substance protein B
MATPSRPPESPRTPRPTIEPPTPVKGTRRLAREKAMQLVSAQDVSGIPWRENFAYVFPVEYRIHEPEYPNRLLAPEEVDLLEADFPIEWDDEMRQFTTELLEACERHADYALELIEKFSENWDVGRIAHIDRVILKIAIAELLTFSEIPPKVTINEAIEVVKKYSTEKSGTFVNGILDAVLAELNTSEKLNKSGRGLINDSLKK